MDRGFWLAMLGIIAIWGMSGIGVYMIHRLRDDHKKSRQNASNANG